MPKVYYNARERRLSINGQDFMAEPIQAKRALEAFGLEIGEELDLYNGTVQKNGAIIRLQPAFIIKIAATRPANPGGD